MYIYITLCRTITHTHTYIYIHMHTHVDVATFLDHPPVVPSWPGGYRSLDGKDTSDHAGYGG